MTRKIILQIVIQFITYYCLVAFGIEDCFTHCKCKWDSNYLEADCSGVNLLEYDTHIPEIPIQHVDFFNNQLSDFPYFLSKMDKLSFLNLRANNLWHLEGNALEGFTALETLILNNNKFVSWKDLNPNTAFKGATNLRTLSLAGNRLNSFSNTNESYLLISHSLLFLDLSHCNITKVSGDFILQGMRSLERLLLDGNPLQSLNPIVSESLQILELKDCNLRKITSNAFDFMPNLVSLYLSENPDLHLMVNRDEYAQSPTLRFLDVSYCNLHSIDIKGFPQLSSLIMTGNRISKLSSTDFENNLLLEYIILSKNTIRSMNSSTFNKLSRLKQVDLSYNVIIEIHAHTFSANLLLEELNLSRNHINKLIKIVSSSLIKLNLSWCEILVIHPNALSQMKNLKVLDISRNLISELPIGLASDQLEELDLSLCRLSSIQNLTFQLFPELIKLKLSGNRFTAPFAESYFRGNPFLEEIWLGDNPWMCLCDNPTFQNFYMFINQRNKIKDKKDLRCGSPQESNGHSWERTCFPTWFPDVNMGRAEKIWTIIMLVIILASVCLCFVSCIRNLIKKRKRWQAERRQADNDRLQMELRNTNASILQQTAQLNAPDPRESNPPCYEEAVLMPKLERSFKSMDELNTNRTKRTLNRSHTANDALTNLDLHSVLTDTNCFLSDERLSKRDQERTDIGRKAFRQTSRSQQFYATSDTRFPASHMKSQNLQSAEQIANLSNYRNSPYSDRKWKMQTDSISFASISDDEMGVHRSIRNPRKNTFAPIANQPTASDQATKISPYSRRRPRGLSISQLSFSNMTDNSTLNLPAISKNQSNTDLEVVSDHFKESDSLLSIGSSEFEVMEASR